LAYWKHFLRRGQVVRFQRSALAFETRHLKRSGTAGHRAANIAPPLTQPLMACASLLHVEAGFFLVTASASGAISRRETGLAFASTAEEPFVEMKYDVEESSLLKAVPPTTRQVLSQSLSRVNTEISTGPGQGLQHRQGNLKQARLQTDDQHRNCSGPVSIRVASIPKPSKNTSQVKFPTHEPHYCVFYNHKLHDRTQT
jgi:hypothetical protein